MASWGKEGGKQRILAQWHPNGGHVLGCIAPHSLSFELWTQSDKPVKASSSSVASTPLRWQTVTVWEAVQALVKGGLMGTLCALLLNFCCESEIALKLAY